MLQTPNHRVNPSAEEIADVLKKVTPTPLRDNGLTADQKIEKITLHMTQILETLGLDLSNDSLQDTPKRVAKMYVNEIFTGLQNQNFPKITLIDNEMNYDQMVVVRDIHVLSMCEHHLMPIHGKATVAYIPHKKVVGLSKINRVVQFFARRPQVQERLTKQVADCLQALLQTEHIAVHIDAKHYCVIARGVEDTSSSTMTSDLRGHFRTVVQTRAEFLSATN